VIIPPIGSLTGQLATTAPEATAQGAGAPGAGTIEPTGGVEATGGKSGFGGALTEAISSLEGGQISASQASQELASGTVKDPEAAVTTVEDAALEMQLAAQIRAKATEAAQTIFQTQV
jgi:flagellar hook-basal body complex protein FliE